MVDGTIQWVDKCLGGETFLICLQETLVNESNDDIFNEIDPLFTYFYINAARKQAQISGHCSGGLVIYSQKNLKHLN